MPVAGPETEVFADIARRYQLRIMLGMLERDDDAVYNSAVLINPNGQVDGLYRKVHLAVGGEIESGILPGEGFPVFETEIGRIGCNICMDSSVTESSRMVGLNGADFLLLPIMGDHRAWQPGLRVFDPGRFRGIMQTRAMDNQVCMVVAVNRTEGSCIIDRLGNVLAWNHGEKEFIQLSALNMEEGHTFKPHKHIWKPGEKQCIAQESWVVIKGSVKVTMYDLDDTIIKEPILITGDCSVTLGGGHTYLALKDNTLVYEYKTGPYKGYQMDKVLI